MPAWPATPPGWKASPETIARASDQISSALLKLAALEQQHPEHLPTRRRQYRRCLAHAARLLRRVEDHANLYQQAANEVATRSPLPPAGAQSDDTLEQPT